MSDTAVMEEILTEPVVWYENFFNNRVKPKACKEMESCGEDFYPWLAEHRPDLYNQIREAETEIDSLWLSRGEKESFKDACKTWYSLLMEAKSVYEAWRAKQREEVLLAGKQEAMVMR